MHGIYSFMHTTHKGVCEEHIGRITLRFYRVCVCVCVRKVDRCRLQNVRGFCRPSTGILTGAHWPFPWAIPGLCLDACISPGPPSQGAQLQPPVLGIYIYACFSVHIRLTLSLGPLWQASRSTCNLRRELREEPAPEPAQSSAKLGEASPLGLVGDSHSPTTESHKSPISRVAQDIQYYYTILYYTILYYTILYYTILYYTILYYTILYYTILYYTILYYTILYYTILYYTILYYTILYYTILYYTILYYTILYYIILYCIILYYTLLYYIILCYTILYYTVLYYTMLSAYGGGVAAKCRVQLSLRVVSCICSGMASCSSF